MKKAISGMTLLETMMAITIGLTIFALGLRQYQSYKRDSEMDQVQYELNTIFEAMAQYYWANCNPPYSYNTDPCAAGNGRSPFVVCPATPSTSQSPISVNITTDLINKNYLKLSDLSLQTIIDHKNQNDNQLVASNGYTLQYNLFYKPDNTIPVRQLCKDNVCTTVGMIILWEMQLGVKLTLTASNAATTYGKLLGAECVSDYADKCGSFPPPPPDQPPPPPTPKYLIFSRFPSQANPETMPASNQMNAMVKEFKSQFETQPDWYLITNPSSTPIYYYCGH